MDNRIQLLMILVVGMLIMEIILIMISIKWLYNIWVNSENIAESSKDFPSIFTKDIEEVKLLYQELKKLIHINGKKEDKILHGLFFSEEIKIHIEMLLTEIREFKKQCRMSEKACNNEDDQLISGVK
ncbi:MAG TPA: hypothetical protein LFW13_00535 [Rickettsia endosymbiont of Sericostoma sp.]|jgi:hypothetical protein|uniref:hypothetical protein n=1 Tax=unclassified Candidatus Tisiphia TaxID=2996318 RepID=UPI001D513146|nr:hypothetical protein [Rickettsia endosymbiont of Sericostoma sp. HW-2014]HJD63498.1 hypothetical protein [Rickettsia endosymbiont of Sericostoma sp.]